MRQRYRQACFAQGSAARFAANSRARCHGFKFSTGQQNRAVSITDAAPQIRIACCYPTADLPRVWLFLSVKCGGDEIARCAGMNLRPIRFTDSGRPARPFAHSAVRGRWCRMGFRSPLGSGERAWVGRRGSGWELGFGCASRNTDDIREPSGFRYFDTR